MRTELRKTLHVRARVAMARLAALITLTLIVAWPQISAAPQGTAPAQDSNGSNSSSSSSNSPSAPADSPATSAPDASKPKKEKKDKDPAPAQIDSWLIVNVTGGADKVPVAEASVYVKFTEVRKIGKNKKLEYDLKTNQDGVARAPDIPQGKVLIQIVAPGWKSFGQYYEVEQDQQTINILLERPPRWY